MIYVYLPQAEDNLFDYLYNSTTLGKTKTFQLDVYLLIFLGIFYKKNNNIDGIPT